MNPPLNVNKIVFASEEEIRAHSRAVVTSILERHRGHEHATLNELGSDKCCGMFEGQILRQVEKKGIDAVIEEHANLIILTKKFDPNIQASSSSGSSAPQNSAPPVCGPSKVFKVNFIVNQGFSVDTSAMISALNAHYSSVTPGLGIYGDRKQLDTKIRFKFESLTTLTGSQIKSFSSTGSLWNQILADPSYALAHGFKENMFNVYFANFNTPQDFGAYAFFPFSFPETCCVIWPTFSSINFSDSWAPYTIVHEFGHSFSLYHPFGANAGAGGGADICEDDSVSDTPLQHRTTNWTRSNMCGDGLSMNENWMDYNSLPPVENHFFTEGQSARMQAAITSSLASYYYASGEICGSCCDGFGNCTETTQAGCIAPSIWTSGQTCTPNPCPGGGGGGGGGGGAGSGIVDVEYGVFSFSDNSLPIPFVSRDQNLIYYRNKHGQTTSITLDGSVIGTFNEINAARNLILSNFSSDFLPLKIIEDNIVIIEFAKCTVKDVSFTPANYGKADYSISLECYEQDLFFSEFFGVLEPKNEFSFEERNDGTVEISHSISARGFLTSGQSALNNAKNFVNSLSGWSSSTNVLPTLIAGINNSNVILVSVSKKIDTASASYFQEESYLAQVNLWGSGAPLISGVISEVTSSLSKNINDPFTTIDINYSIQGDKHVLPSSLRGYIPSSAVLFNLAVEALNSASVNSVPLSYKIQDEAETRRKISISTSYNTDIITGSGYAYLDYKVDFQTDHVTDITTASIDAEIIAKGTARNKYSLASGFLTSIIQSPEKLDGHLYNKVNQVYLQIFGSSWPLNNFPQSLTVSENQNRGTISLNASFSNEDFISGCSSAGYSLDVTPQLKKLSAKPGSNLVGLYGVFDLNTSNLEELRLNGNLIGTNKISGSDNFKSAYIALVDNVYDAFIDSPDLTAQTTPVLIKEGASTGIYPNLTISFDQTYKIDRTKIWG